MTDNINCSNIFGVNKNTEPENKKITPDMYAGEKIRSITMADLLSDARARRDQDALQILINWSDDELMYAKVSFTNLRNQYLVAFCGMEEPVRNKKMKALKDAKEDLEKMKNENK